MVSGSGSVTTWFPRELAIWEPPRRMTVSEWADEHRVIGRGSSKPGRWSTSFVPYTREIMDTFTDPEVSEVTLIKSAQSSGTECMLNIIGYVIDQDPSPTLYVMPRDDDWSYIRMERVGPMLEETSALARHITSTPTDLSKGTLRFDRCSVFFAGAGSAAGLASKPIRFGVMDELDKHPGWTGKEADAVSLVRARMRTFPDRKLYKLSTPTTRLGAIWQEWEASDRRRYHVPCHACGHVQVMRWSQVKYPAGVASDELARGGDVHYECERCQAHWTDAQRRAACSLGQWVPDGCEPGGTFPSASHRGYHVTSLLSPFVTMGELAAKWVRAQGNPAKLQDFANSDLGEIWEERIDRTTPAQVAAAASGYEEGTVPAGALVVVAGADVQKTEIYYEVRAFGPSDESWLVVAGRCDTLDQLGDMITESRWPGPSGTLARIRLACVDSGYRTDEVYDLAARFPDVIRAVKGYAQQRGGPVLRGNPIDRTVRGRAIGIAPWTVDTSYFKDKAARVMRSPEMFHVPQFANQAWVSHVTSEQKVLDRKRNGTTREVWAPVPGAGPNHWLDCMIYSYAAAYMLGMHRVESTQAVEREPAASVSQRDDRPTRGSSWLDGGSARRGKWL